MGQVIWFPTRKRSCLECVHLAFQENRLGGVSAACGIWGNDVWEDDAQECEDYES